MIHLITPEEAEKAKISSIPDYVFQAFNELLCENFVGSAGTIIYQYDVIKRIVALYPYDNDNYTQEDKDVVTNSLFTNHWLDVEKFYEKAGWDVTYNKPAYYEDFDPYYNFIPKKNENKQ